MTAGAEEARIGVYLCQCGGNIGDVVDIEGVRDSAGEWDNVIVARHDDYQSYLEARRLDGPGNAKGLCDYGAFQTLVSAEGLASEDLHALVLHELSHLFFFATAPAVMPDWFAEGFAETFGGQGTFDWDGKKLQVMLQQLSSMESRYDR